MRKILLVVHHELGRTLRRPSFLLLSFGLPFVAIAVVVGLTLLKARSSGGGSTAPDVQTPQFVVEGYVDQAGLVNIVPEGVASDHLRAYTDEVQAQQALACGEISAYYVVPSGFVERGEVFYVYPDTKALTTDGQEWVMLWTLLVNLLGGDEELAGWIWNPMDLEATNLTATLEQGTSTGGPSPALRFLPAIMVALFYACFMINASLLSESVGSEKENRTIEVVMLSITPRQMLAGKIIGLGIAALLHTTAWVGTVFVVLRRGAETLDLPPGFVFPPSIVAWGLAFFLLGFAIYASLVAGVGALAPKLKEASHAPFLVLSPLMAGYVVGLLASLAGETEGTLLTALSLFPLTAPVVMVMRLTVGGVPWWHLLLSSGLMVVTAYGIVRAVAAMFHAQNLLSGQAFSIKRYVRALLR